MDSTDAQTNSRDAWTRGLAILAGLVLAVSLFLLWVGHASDQRFQRVSATPPQSAFEVAGLAPGATVVAEGRIDPATPAPEGSLSLFVRERYVRSYDSNSRKYRNDWETDRSTTPSFLLDAAGAVRVVNDDYSLGNPSVRESGPSEVGATRLHGFRPGDRVTVVGTRAEAGIRAEIVFGGTREQYLASLREGSGFATRWGRILLLVGLAGLAPAAISHLRRRAAMAPMLPGRSG